MPPAPLAACTCLCSAPGSAPVQVFVQPSWFPEYDSIKEPNVPEDVLEVGGGRGVGRGYHGFLCNHVGEGLSSFSCNLEEGSQSNVV